MVRMELLSGTVDRLRAAGCVFAEEEAELLVAEAASAQQLDRLVARRVQGIPLEVVLGWARFCGLRIEVDAGVFVPRRRTTFLVDRAVAVAADRAGALAVAPPGAGVVDLCCGTRAGRVAAAGRVPSDREQPAPGAAHRAGDAGGRPGPAGGPVGGVRLDRRDRSPPADQMTIR